MLGCELVPELSPGAEHNWGLEIGLQWERPHSSLDYRTPSEFAALLVQAAKQNLTGTYL